MFSHTASAPAAEIDAGRSPGASQEPSPMFRPDFIVATRIRTDVEVASKKRLLQTLAGLLAEGGPGLIADTIFERLIERERLGSTGLGHGIALPHARMRDKKKKD
jgi:mannitol/fructose-specific phosphotransferase system IIA component (Ntr-type)